jgi:hypothetical protein
MSQNERGMYEAMIDEGFPIRCSSDDINRDQFDDAVAVINDVDTICVFDLMSLVGLSYTQASYVLYELQQTGLLRSQTTVYGYGFTHIDNPLTFEELYVSDPSLARKLEIANDNGEILLY